MSSSRITTLHLESAPDRFGRVQFTLYWVRDVPEPDQAEPAEDYFGRARGQVFFTDPKALLAKATLDNATIVTAGKAAPEKPWAPVCDFTVAEMHTYWNTRYGFKQKQKK